MAPRLPAHASYQRLLALAAVAGLLGSPAAGRAGARPTDAPDALTLLCHCRVGHDPGDDDGYLQTVARGLGRPAPLTGERLAALIQRRLSRSAGEARYPLVSFVRSRVVDVREEIVHGRFATAVALMEEVHAAVARHPAAVMTDPQVRRHLFAGTLAQVKGLLRLRQHAAAAALVQELGRSFPDFAVTEEEHGPELAGFVTTAAARAARATRAALTVTTHPSGAALFLNERYVGTAPLTVANLLPGPYRLTARRGERYSRVHTVTLGGDPARVDLDLAFDAAVTGSGFSFPTEAARRRHAAAYALRLGRAVGARQVILAGLRPTVDGPRWGATLYDTHAGAALREAAVALAPTLPRRALLLALGRFLRGQDAAAGLIVAAAPGRVAPPRREHRAPLHAATAPRDRSPSRWLHRLLLYAGLGVGVAAVGAGAVLLYLDGRGSCSAPPCPELYATGSWGIAAVAGGGAVTLLTAALLYRSSRRRPPVVGLAPRPDGAAAHLHLAW